jgi:hypothetical protein
MGHSARDRRYETGATALVPGVGNLKAPHNPPVYSTGSRSVNSFFEFSIIFFRIFHHFDEIFSSVIMRKRGQKTTCCVIYTGQCTSRKKCTNTVIGLPSGLPPSVFTGSRNPNQIMHLGSTSRRVAQSHAPYAVPFTL